jgi:hypothetical protein
MLVDLLQDEVVAPIHVGVHKAFLPDKDHH